MVLNDKGWSGPSILVTMRIEYIYIYIYSRKKKSRVVTSPTTFEPHASYYEEENMVGNKSRCRLGIFTHYKALHAPPEIPVGTEIDSAFGNAQTVGRQKI